MIAGFAHAAVALVAVLAVAWLGRVAARRLRQPEVIGEIGTGLLLGPLIILLAGHDGLNRLLPGFEPYSWRIMLIGLGAQPRRPLPALAHASARRARAALGEIPRRAERLVSELPACRTYLSQLHA